MGDQIGGSEATRGRQKERVHCEADELLYAVQIGVRGKGKTVLQREQPSSRVTSVRRQLATRAKGDSPDV